MNADNLPNAQNYYQHWGGYIYSGHTGRSNYLFADGHVKTMLPLQTLDKGEGGSGDVNMWTTDNVAWNDPKITPVPANAATAAQANLATVTTNYK